MKIDKKLIKEVDELWDDHAEALEHFGNVCAQAALDGHASGVRRKAIGFAVIIAAALAIKEAFAKKW